MNPSPNVLFVTWQSPENRATFPIARLLHRGEEPRYEFVFVRGVHDAEQHGLTLFRELPETGRVYWFDELPPLFTSRLMRRSRPDFVDHVTRLGLGNLGDALPPELILARSEGRKVTDHIEIAAPADFDPASRSWIYHGFARGLRHVPGAEEAVRTLRVGDELGIEPDIANEWSTRALSVRRADRARLGFVPHILVGEFGGLIESDAAVRAHVARVNLPPAPMHQRLLVRFSRTHCAGFAPMSTSRFQPLAADATVVHLGSAADHLRTV